MTTLAAVPPSPSLLFSKSSHPPTSPSLAPDGVAAQDQVRTSALLLSSTAREQDSIRPAKNIEAFNKLLPPEVEFVEGSSTGTIGISLERKYEPINGSPKASSELKGKGTLHGSLLTRPQTFPRTPAPSPKRKRADSPERTRSLYAKPINLAWPSNAPVGSGYYNLGNTCFLNSALQCILHIPPLLHILIEHAKAKTQCQCHSKHGFCMICLLAKMALDTYNKGSNAFSPSLVTKNLHHFAKHLRRGRQEDSHEFLRYAIDALQKSAIVVAGQSLKLEPKIAETTWVHKIFGGGLRSRVTCSRCGYNSDTFDSILDLSIDIDNVNNLRAALKKFTAIDHLKGADKYKCDKCKKPVNAEKSFSVHKAPMVLTLHLKRFTPLGRKLGHMVAYEERLSLESVMSKGQYGPKYALCGIISHAGGGPNSGHYYAHVKAANGNWYEMNDESVERTQHVPINMKNAYILFYMQLPGQALQASIKTNSASPSLPRSNGVHNLAQVVATSKKRKTSSSDDERGDTGAKESKPFIGPKLPPPVQISAESSESTTNGHTSSTSVDPNAESLKKKIRDHTTNTTSESLQSKLRAGQVKPLVNYPDEDEDEDTGETVVRTSIPSGEKSSFKETKMEIDSSEINSSPNHPPPSSPPLVSSPVATQSFYGKGQSAVAKQSNGPIVEEKTKYFESLSQSMSSKPGTPIARPSLNGANPFGKSRVGNSIDSSHWNRRTEARTYGSKTKKRRPLF